MARKAAVLQPEMDMDVAEMPSTIVYTLVRKLPPRGMVYDEKGRKRPDPEFNKHKTVPKISAIFWPGGTDPFTGKERKIGRYPIRYYSGCETLFVDGQPKDKEVIESAMNSTPDIDFIHGYREVNAMDTMQVAYLDMCSWNAESPYRSKTAATLFKRLDIEKIADEEADLMDRIEEALDLAKKASAKHMRTHARFLGIPDYDFKSNVKYDDKAMRAKYRKYATENPKRFIETYNDKSAQIKVWIEQLLENGSIDTNIIPNRAVWKDKGEIICDLSGIKTREGILNKLIEFAQTPEGEDFLTQLKGIFV